MKDEDRGRDSNYTQRIELAALFRAMHHYGWEDLVYTHASIRLDEDHYLTNDFSEMFHEICASSLLKVNLKKKPKKGQNVAGYTIHSAIYKARPDVNCIIHTHTPAGIAVASNKKGLWAASQAAMLTAGSLSRHFYHGVVDTEESSEQLVKDLGSTHHMLMANHGLLTVGRTVALAFHRMQRLESACQAQVLMNIDQTDFINENVILKQVEQSREADWERPGTDLAWQAVMRLVAEKYPGFRA